MNRKSRLRKEAVATSRDPDLPRLQHPIESKRGGWNTTQMPAEIWLECFSYFDPSKKRDDSAALASLCRVSSQFASLARPILYSTIHMVDFAEAPDLYDVLGSSNNGLSVRDLTLDIDAGAFEVWSKGQEGGYRLLPSILQLCPKLERLDIKFDNDFEFFVRPPPVLAASEEIAALPLSKSLQHLSITSIDDTQFFDFDCFGFLISIATNLQALNLQGAFNPMPLLRPLLNRRIGEPHLVPGLSSLSLDYSYNQTTPSDLCQLYSAIEAISTITTARIKIGGISALASTGGQITSAKTIANLYISLHQINISRDLHVLHQIFPKIQSFEFQVRHVDATQIDIRDRVIFLACKRLSIKWALGGRVDDEDGNYSDGEFADFNDLALNLRKLNWVFDSRTWPALQGFNLIVDLTNCQCTYTTDQLIQLAREWTKTAISSLSLSIIFRTSKPRSRNMFVEIGREAGGEFVVLKAAGSQ